MPLPRIAIATGDPAGIGPEIALKAALDARVRAVPAIAGRRPGRGGTACPAAGLSPHLHIVQKAAGRRLVERRGQSARRTRRRQRAGQDRYGRRRLRAGFAGERSRAIKAALTGEVEAVVAAPQTERSIAAAGIAFDGYPSFVARETGTPVEDVYLMICFDKSRIVHATLHVSVREAVALITPERVERVIRVTDASLKKLGIAQPKIFVSGLNPHAGEEGMFGSEEIDIISPAIARAAKDGIEASGPFGADTMFRKKGCEPTS